MKGLKISYRGNDLKVKPTNKFFANLPTEQEILDCVSSAPPEHGYFLEFTIRGTIGLATGRFIPPMYSTPINIGGSI